MTSKEESYWYFHDIFHYDEKGLMTSREFLNKKQKLDRVDHYVHNSKDQLTKIVRRNAAGELLSPIVNYRYNKDGMLIFEERLYSHKKAETTRAIFKQRKSQVTVRAFNEDEALLRSSQLIRFNEARQCEPEIEWFHSEIVTHLVDKGYRVTESREYSLEDGRLKKKYSYFYDQHGNMRCKWYFKRKSRRLAPGYFITFKYDNDLRLIEERCYYVSSKKNRLTAKLSDQERYICQNNRLTKKIIHYGDGSLGEAKYLYNRKGLLYKIIDDEIGGHQIMRYDSACRMTRHESYEKGKKTPIITEQWRYNDIGKIAEHIIISRF